MRFDLIDHQFDFPTLMIQLDQRERWRHARVEQRRYQAIHLAWLSQARIGHPIGDDAHPHAALQGIASMSRMGWFHPSQHRAISQAALLAQVLPRSRFQGSQDMGATRTNMLGPICESRRYAPCTSETSYRSISSPTTAWLPHSANSTHFTCG